MAHSPTFTSCHPITPGFQRKRSRRHSDGASRHLPVMATPFRSPWSSRSVSNREEAPRRYCPGAPMIGRRYRGLHTSRSVSSESRLLRFSQDRRAATRHFWRCPALRATLSRDAGEGSTAGSPPPPAGSAAGGRAPPASCPRISPAGSGGWRLRRRPAVPCTRAARCRGSGSSRRRRR